MARFCAEKETATKFKAAEYWKQRCLLSSGSVFSQNSVWTVEHLQALNQYFVNNLDEGEGDFFAKLETQIASTAPEVKQLAAEMMWVMLLCPSNIGADKKRESVSRIWQWSGSPFQASDALINDDVLSGIGSAGTSYNTNRWRELVYFINFALEFCKLPLAKREELLQNGWDFASWLELVPENDSRQLRHMLLFLLFPDNFERIFGGADRREVVTTFSGKPKSEILKWSALQIDRELHAIRKKQQEDYGSDQLDFYIPPLIEQWRDTDSKQWLFTWNPQLWPWADFPEAISQVRKGKTYKTRWSCSNSHVQPGDRAWLIRLGAPPKGIIATGNVVSEPYEELHWDAEKAEAGKTSLYVDIELSQIIDPYKDPFVSQDDLNTIKIDNQNWSPQQSGIEIKKRSAGLLQKLWSQVTKRASSRSAVTPFATVSEPQNLILYGPPGTGKTYELSNLLEKYTTPSSIVSREQWLAQELQSIRWFDVICMALYTLGGSAKVADIEQHEFLQQKAKAIGRTKNVRAQIWATLQSHTVEESVTVKYAKRLTPQVFDKSTDSTWRLVGDWRDACEDQIQQADALKKGPPDCQGQARYEFVTFHQAYGYEDFVEGLRPIIDEDSGEVVYKVIPGVFRRLCQLAVSDPAHRYALFIDEINRGNIAKIFGELITLIERDKRTEFDAEGKFIKGNGGIFLTLPYSGERFTVPKNLDIYGTMNTADRSIALLDTALRRRFNFKELMPNSSIISGSRGDGYIEDGEGGVINLRAMLDAMNQRIRFLLNRDMMLGHAYLCNVKDFLGLKEVILNQFIPLLQEYFYDDWRRIQLVFRDIAADGKKLEPQIIEHSTLRKIDIIGFDHDDYEDLIEYRVARSSDITPEGIRKIYENANVER